MKKLTKKISKHFFRLAIGLCVYSSFVNQYGIAEEVVKKNVKVEDENTNTDSTSRMEMSDQDLPTYNESWYILFDSAFSTSSFSGKIGQRNKDLNNMDKSDTKSDSLGGFDLGLGVYFPINNHRTLIGPKASVGVTGKNITSKQNNRDYNISASQFDFGGSVIHYFGANIGSGFFLKGDVGLSRTTYKVEQDSFCYFNCDNDIEFSDGEKWSFDGIYDSKSYESTGFFSVVGAGYSWGLGKKMRMHSLLSFHYRPTEFGNVNSANLTLGMLF